MSSNDLDDKVRKLKEDKKPNAGQKTVSFIIIGVIFLFVFLLFTGGSDKEKSKPLAGNMTHGVICSTAGLIVKRALGDNFTANSSDCVAQSSDGINVEITSSYNTPFNTTMYYTARGAARNGTLRITEISIHGVDSDFIPFSAFP